MSTPLADLLRQLRNDTGLTLKEVSAQTTVSYSYISEVESGVAMPTILTLERLLNFYGYRLTVISLKADKTAPGRFVKITQLDGGV